MVTRPATGGNWPHPQHGQIQGDDSGQKKGEETSSAHLQLELGVHISEDLTWTVNITQLVKKAQQQRDLFRRLREVRMSSEILAAMTAASSRAS